LFSTVGSTISPSSTYWTTFVPSLPKSHYFPNGSRGSCLQHHHYRRVQRRRRRRELATLSVPFYYYGNVAESAGLYWSNIFVTCTTSISCDDDYTTTTCPIAATMQQESILYSNRNNERLPKRMPKQARSTNSYCTEHFSTTEKFDVHSLFVIRFIVASIEGRHSVFSSIFLRPSYYM
jgi:hypothetical protein